MYTVTAGGYYSKISVATFFFITYQSTLLKRSHAFFPYSHTPPPTLSQSSSYRNLTTTKCATLSPHISCGPDQVLSPCHLSWIFAVYQICCGTYILLTFSLKVEVACSFRMLVFINEMAWHHNPDSLSSHCC